MPNHPVNSPNKVRRRSIPLSCPECLSNEAVEMGYPWKRDHQRTEWLPLEKLQTTFQQIQTIAL
ncbi:Hypothetical protein FKW44_001652, partial [Caligus rogercresseyi]